MKSTKKACVVFGVAIVVFMAYLALRKSVGGHAQKKIFQNNEKRNNRSELSRKSRFGNL